MKIVTLLVPTDRDDVCVQIQSLFTYVQKIRKFLRGVFFFFLQGIMSQSLPLLVRINICILYILSFVAKFIYLMSIKSSII